MKFLSLQETLEFQAWSSFELVTIFCRVQLCCSYFSNIFFHLQTFENIEELTALFANSDGMDILSHIGLRRIPSKADMTCNQVVLSYLTSSYQHCYCRCEGNVFFILELIFMSTYFFLGCFVYHISVLFVSFNTGFVFFSAAVYF